MPTTKPYGQELAFDIYDADPAYFTRNAIGLFCARVSEAIGVHLEPRYFWDYEDCPPSEKAAAPPHMKGTSAVQFLSTSSIVIHTLDDLRMVFVNVFVCGEFDGQAVMRIGRDVFGGEVRWWGSMQRGANQGGPVCEL